MSHEPLPDNLGSLNKPDLVKLCEARNLSPDGTVPELLERLHASEPTADPVEVVNASGHGLTLAVGTPLEPSERGIADRNDPHDAALLDSGALIPTEDK